MGEFDVLSFLKQVALFCQLSDEDLRRLLEIGKQQSFLADETATAVTLAPERSIFSALLRFIN